MSSAEALYTARVAYPDYLVRAKTQAAALEIYRDGALVTPTQAGSTFSLLYGDTTVIAATGVTVTASIATYSIASGDLPSTLTLGDGYVEEWRLLIAGVERVYRRDARLVLHAAYPVITDADIAAVYSNLSSQRASTVTSFQAAIDEAWKRILGRLEAQGVFPEHVVTSWSLREVHLELALHLICLDCHRAAGGRWGELASGHKKEFEMAWGRLRFVRGIGADGSPDTSNMTPGNRGVTFVNASPRTSWRGFGGL